MFGGFTEDVKALIEQYSKDEEVEVYVQDNRLTPTRLLGGYEFANMSVEEQLTQRM